MTSNARIIRLLFGACLALSPRAIAASTPRPLDYLRHLERLQRRLPSGFHALVQPPFIVVGNETPELLGMRARRTVAWAVAKLRDAYGFARVPRRILEIWLLKDAATYRHHARRLTGERPSTPYGFYSPSAGALIMNISTGGGTLVHEIVHPLIEANFPDCPPWFNEGLGSLYEQAAERDGQIVGLPNWRLPGLQQALRRGEVPAFRRLMAMNGFEFYQRDRGTNYGQARYLLYYLQQRGLLRRYYQRFRAQHRRDPSGYRTLLEVLGVRKPNAFRRHWEAYVLALRYR